MKSPRTRWRCPTCEDTVLGLKRPRRDDVCRYCLSCSAKAGRLVRRIAPTLERVRARARAIALERTRLHGSLKRRQKTLQEIAVAGVPLYPYLRSRKMRWPVGTRALRTKGPGPIGGTLEKPVVRYGDWADVYDAHAQAIVLGATQSRYYADGDENYRRRVIRSYAEGMLGVRPRLESIAMAPVEIALLLRQKAAARELGGETTMKRVS